MVRQISWVLVGVLITMGLIGLFPPRSVSGVTSQHIPVSRGFLFAGWLPAQPARRPPWANRGVSSSERRGKVTSKAREGRPPASRLSLDSTRDGTRCAIDVGRMVSECSVVLLAGGIVSGVIVALHGPGRRLV